MGALDALELTKYEELQEVLRRQTVLSRFGKLILRSNDFDEILTEACRLVGDALDTGLAKVMELGTDGETLAVRAGVGWQDGVVGVVTLKMSDLTSEGHALKTGRPMTSPDIATETRFKYPEFLTDHGVQALANVLIPGSHGRPPFGVLQIDSRVPRAFTDHDLAFLSSYANLLATAVDRLRVVGEVHQGEVLLRESEARLARAISAAGIRTWEWDAVSDTLHFSHGFEALQGQAAEIIPSVTVLQQEIHPSDWLTVTMAVKQLLQDRDDSKLEREFQVMLPSGTTRWLRVTGSAEQDVTGRLTRVTGITQDITISHDAERRILHMARHDGLTGLLNRHTLWERLEEILLRTKRGEGCAVLALDLDRFKEVNDTLGHAVGDAVLCSVATRLLEAVRETDVVARPGGDEFVVIQLGLHQPRDAEALATRIVATLSQPHEIDGQKVSTGVSIGIAVAPEDGTDVEQVLRCADLALYGSKGDDAARFRFFEPGMQARAHNRRQLVADLRQALVRGEFELHYQPLVELSRNRIVGFEALVRWRHPVRGLTLPGAFISVTEETGLIEPLGEWILHKACADAAAWPSEIKVTVNLSAVQFSKGNLHRTVTAALEEAGLVPQRLELEITEGLLLQENEANLTTLRQLRKHGVSIVMDDFGVGYSSLSYLYKFPFDKVKIDRSFVAAAQHKASGAAIIRAVAELCKDLGVITNAEGIETPEQLRQIMDLGCTEGQGYFFSPPRPSADIPALLSNWLQADPVLPPESLQIAVATVTERSREQELEQKIADLMVAVEARDTFIAFTAHELRSPLTPISGQIEFLLSTVKARRGSPEQVEQRLERLQHAVGRFVKRAGVLLNISRINGGKLHFELEQCDLAALVRGVADEFAAEATHIGTSITLFIPDHLPGIWDRLAIEQIIDNLVSNALKYGDRTPIEISAEVIGEQVRIQVRDYGHGIPVCERTRVFGRFERVVRQGEQRTGSGVGLWVVAQLTEAMDGSVMIEDAPGKGAQIIVTLPQFFEGTRF